MSDDASETGDGLLGFLRWAKKKGIAPDNVVELKGRKFVVVPENETHVPQLDLALPLKHLAQALGSLAKGADLFRQGDQFVTVDAATGRERPMSSARFCSWVEEVAWPYRMVENKRTGEWAPRYSRVGKDTAQLLLESDEFRRSVRELRGVHEVRLPVWREEGGKRKPELLPEGYDEACGIFTADTIPFDCELGPNEAHNWLEAELASYPWANDTSRAVHVAGMISPFIRLLLPDGSKRLMIIHNGNQPGTGKSTLARMDLAGVYGAAAVKSVDRDPAELRKVLDTCAFERKPYLFLDNMTDLRSPELNAFVTSGRWSARVLGKSQTVEVQVEAQVFINGNQLDVGRELARRAAVCELFLATDPLERKFSHEITDEWLVKPTTRAKLLAVTWAAVRHWCNEGKPIDPRARRPSFEAYTELVGSIVTAFGFGAPFVPAEITGDTEGQATKELLDAAALFASSQLNARYEFTNPELLEIADQKALLDVIVPYAKDQAKALGRRLKAWKGRELTDGKGRRYRFGKRDGNAGALYMIEILSSADACDESPRPSVVAVSDED